MGKKVRFFKLPEFKETKVNIEIELDEYYGNRLKEPQDIAYVAFSSKKFYLRTLISKFVLLRNYVPLNPFMSFDYFLADLVDRDKILFSNSAFIERAKELWVFGEISDGVLAEILLAKKLGKKIRYFEIVDSKKIKEIPKADAKFEKGLEKFRELIYLEETNL